MILKPRTKISCGLRIKNCQSYILHYRVYFLDPYIQTKWDIIRSLISKVHGMTNEPKCQRQKMAEGGLCSQATVRPIEIRDSIQSTCIPSVLCSCDGCSLVVKKGWSTPAYARHSLTALKREGCARDRKAAVWDPLRYPNRLAGIAGCFALFSAVSSL